MRSSRDWTYALNAKYKTTNKWATADEASLSPDEAEEFHEYQPDGGFPMRYDFPRFGRHLALVGIYGFVENKLLTICDRCQKSLSLTPRKSGHSGLASAEKYLTNVVKIPLLIGGDNWKCLNSYRHLRNWIVHCDSRVRDYKDPTSKGRQEFDECVDNTGQIDINSLGQFTLSRE